MCANPPATRWPCQLKNKPLDLILRHVYSIEANDEKCVLGQNDISRSCMYGGGDTKGSEGVERWSKPRM